MKKRIFAVFICIVMLMVSNSTAFGDYAYAMEAESAVNQTEPEESITTEEKIPDSAGTVTDESELIETDVIPETQTEAVMTNLADAVPVSAADLPELIDALEAGETEIVLSAAITLNADFDMDVYIPASVEEVTIYASGARHFLIGGADVHLNLGKKVILDGGGSAGGIQVNTIYADVTSFILTGGTIQNCQALTGGGLLVNANSASTSTASIEIKQTNFYNNSASNSGGAYYQSSASKNSINYSVAINGASFIQNNVTGTSSSNRGGAVYIGQYINLMVDGCAFESNAIGSTGGSLSLDNGVHAEVKNTSITGSQASLGAALYLRGTASDPTNVELDQVLMESNAATTSGGAIYANATFELTINNSQFNDNTAVNTSVNRGGALFLNGTAAEVEINKTEFNRNKSRSEGGAIFINGTTNVSVKGATKFSSNSSTASNGGSIYLYNGSISFDGPVTMSENSAKGGGGALYIYYGAATFNDTVKMIGNTAASGGAIYATSAQLEVNSGIYFENNAATDGPYKLMDNTLKDHPATTTALSLSYPFEVSGKYPDAFNNMDIYYVDAAGKFNTLSYTSNGAATGERSTEYYLENDETIVKGIEELGYTRAGYSFRGWKTSLSSTVEYQPGDTFVMAKRDVTLYADWTPQYEVNFYANYPDGNDELLYHATLNASTMIDNNNGSLFELPEFDGYSLMRWNTEPDGSGTSYILTGFRVASDLQLYGQWTKLVKLTFDLNYDNQIYQEYSLLPGYGQIVPADPTREGYVFKGWSRTADGDVDPNIQAGSFSPVIVEDTVIYAQWIKRVTFLQYNTDDPDDGVYKTVTVNEGDIVTVPEDPQRTGYRFDGWSLDGINADPVYEAGYSFEIADHLTLYPVWTKVMVVNLYYNASNSDASKYTIELETGEEYELPEFEWRQSYRGNNWNTERDGSGSAYLPGDKIVFDENLDYFNLYVEWNYEHHGVNVVSWRATDPLYGAVGYFDGYYLSQWGERYGEHQYVYAYQEPVKMVNYVSISFKALTEEQKENGNVLADTYVVVSDSDGRFTAQIPEVLWPYIADYIDENGVLNRPVADLQAENQRAYNHYIDHDGRSCYFVIKGDQIEEIASKTSAYTYITLTEYFAPLTRPFVYEGAPLEARYPYKFGIETYSNSSSKPSSANYGSYSFLEPVIGISLEQSVSKEEVSIGEKIKITLEAGNLSNIDLENVAINIYNSNDAASTKRLDNMSNVVISCIGYDGTIIYTKPLDAVNTLPIGVWEGDMNANHEVPQTYSFVVTFDYIVSASDIIGGSIPVYAVIDGLTPEKSFSVDAVYEDEYYYCGPGLEIVNPVSDDDIDVLKVKKTTVTYDPNGGLGEVYLVDGLWSGEVHTVLDNDTDSNLKYTRAKYYFNGWNTEADGSGTSYQSGDELITLPENITLYAQWKGALKVTFDANGGNYPDDSTQYTEGGYSIDDYVDNSNVPKLSREGYEFTGKWYLDKECTIEWNFEKDTLEDDLTLYAGWEKITEPTNPTGPTEPTEATEPTDLTEPTDSTETTNPTDPTSSNNSGGSTKPADSTGKAGSGTVNGGKGSGVRTGDAYAGEIVFIILIGACLVIFIMMQKKQKAR